MIKQQTVICLYQNNCKDGESLGRQKQACRQAVNKLFWNIRAELICDQDADVPLMCRNAMQEARQQAKDGTYTVLMISREEDLLCEPCEAENMIREFLDYKVNVFCTQTGFWRFPEGRHWAPTLQIKGIRR